MNVLLLAQVPATQQNAATNSPSASSNASASISYWTQKGIDYVIDHAGSILGAIVILVMAFFVAKSLGRLLQRWLNNKQMEPPVRNLITRIARLVVFFLGLVMAVGTLGIAIMPLVAGLSVVGVGVGLAMQGVLSNLVAGMLIIFVKPFRVGEYIEILSVHGQVVTIELFSTTLVHADFSKVVIPNRKIVGEILHNYGTMRQVDITVGVSYSTDVNRALKIVEEILAQNPRVLKVPAPIFAISQLADSSVNIAVKPFTNIANFAPTKGEIYHSILERFREEKIEIPFPQRDIRILSNPGTRTAA